MKKVHTFKFSKNDLISVLKVKGIKDYSTKTIDEAMKQISLTKAVEYVIDNTFNC